jgi:hypothetical protein
VVFAAGLKGGAVVPPARVGGAVDEGRGASMAGDMPGGEELFDKELVPVGAPDGVVQPGEAAGTEPVALGARLAGGLAAGGW